MKYDHKKHYLLLVEEIQIIYNKKLHIYWYWYTIFIDIRFVVSITKLIRIDCFETE